MKPSTTIWSSFSLLLMWCLPWCAVQQLLQDFSCIDETVPITLSAFLGDDYHDHDIRFILRSAGGKEITNTTTDRSNRGDLFYQVLFLEALVDYRLTVVNESESGDGDWTDENYYRIYSGRDLWADQLLLESEKGTFSSRTHIIQAPLAVDPIVVSPASKQTELVNVSVAIEILAYDHDYTDMVAWRVDSPDGKRTFAYAPPGSYPASLVDSNATKTVSLPPGEYRFVKTQTRSNPFKIVDANAEVLAMGLDETVFFSVSPTIPRPSPSPTREPTVTQPPEGNVPITLAIQMDSYAQEISWRVQRETDGFVVATKEYTGGDRSNDLVTQVLYLVPDMEYRLIMLDSAGDGLESGGYFALYFGRDTQSPLILRVDDFKNDRREITFDASLPPPTAAPTISSFADVLILTEIPGFYQFRLESIGTEKYLVEDYVDFGGTRFSDLPRNEWYRFSISNTSCCQNDTLYYDGYVWSEQDYTTVDSRLFKGQDFRFRKDHIFFLRVNRPVLDTSRIGKTPITIEIELDGHPEDASWQFLSADGTYIYGDVPRGTYTGVQGIVREVVHVPPNGDYAVVISDESHEDATIYRVRQGTETTASVIWSGSVSRTFESELFFISVGSGRASQITVPVSVQFQLSEVTFTSSYSSRYYADREDDVTWEIATVEDGDVVASGVFEILSKSIRDSELASYPVEVLEYGVPYLFRIQWKEQNVAWDKVRPIFPYRGDFNYVVTYANQPDDVELSLPAGTILVDSYGDDVHVAEETEFLIFDHTSTPPAPDPVSIIILIRLDGNPEETSWNLKMLDFGDIVFDASPGTYSEPFSTVEQTLQVFPGRMYQLTQKDSLFDGIECDTLLSVDEPLVAVYHELDGNVGPKISSGGNCTDLFDTLSLRFYVSSDPKDETETAPTMVPGPPSSLPVCDTDEPDLPSTEITIVIDMTWSADEASWYLETLDGSTNVTSVSAGTYEQGSYIDIVTVDVARGAQYRFVAGSDSSLSYKVFYGNCTEPGRLLIRGEVGGYGNPDRVERTFRALPPSSGALVPISLEISLDQFPETTGWEITDLDGRSVHKILPGAYVGCRGVKKLHTLPVMSLRQYDFALTGDLCCEFGKGSYTFYHGSNDQAPVLLSSLDLDLSLRASFFVENSSETISTQSPSYAPSSDLLQRTPSPVVSVDPLDEQNIPLIFEVQLDHHPKEFGWEILSVDRSVKYVSVPPGSYVNENTLEVQNVHLPSDAKYLLALEDVGRDGLCCEYGRGFVNLFYSSSQGDRFIVASERGEGGFAFKDIPFTLPPVSTRSCASLREDAFCIGISVCFSLVFVLIL